MLLALRYVPLWRRQASVLVGVALWVAIFKSGIDPVIAGLAVGLVTSAYPPSREDLERATALTRSFREQPTPELARSAQLSVLVGDLAERAPPVQPAPVDELRDRAAVRARERRHPPDGGRLGDAISSPITLGILVGYVVGKPLGIMTASWIGLAPGAHGPRRRSAGRCSAAAAPWPGSASPSRC